VLGWAVNLGLRIGMLAMLADVLRAGPDDHRFVAKGIGPRFAAVGLPASLLLPALWVAADRAGAPRVPGPRLSYPFWIDNLYLSMLALDLAGNVFDLYDGYEHFDLIPHAHGTGVVTVLAAWLFRLPVSRAVGVASVGHAVLEAQEIASDRAFGFRNVRGAWDSIGDLSAGLVGSLAYAAAYHCWVRKAGREPPSLLP
jgi:hypothetical protein